MLLNDADIWQQRGAALLKQGSYDDAVAAFDQALIADPSRSDALIGRAGALMELERAEDAFLTFDRAAVLKPDMAEIWYYRGNALKHLKRYDDALASFERALALKPGLLQVHSVRADLFRTLGRTQEAADDTETYERLLFRSLHGYEPNLRVPRSFSEKVVHRKLFVHNPIFSVLADKWAVRTFVAERAGSEVLNDVCCVVSDPDDIDFSALPDAFVIKATHGSGFNLFVRNKAELDIASAKETCRSLLKRKYGEGTNQPHYLAIEPRLIAEPFLTETNGKPAIDYKLFVFHGRCHYVLVHFGRFEEHTARFFDRDWKTFDVTQYYPLGPVMAPPPCLPRLLETAEKIAAGFDFLRVDLYSPDGERVVFGEITVTPGAGHQPFRPDARFDFELGALW
jgi:hypothetical protein